jgi:hypothetical protein
VWCLFQILWCFFRITDISSRERVIYSRHCNVSSIGRCLFTSPKFIVLNFNPRIQINNLLLIKHEAEWIEGRKKSGNNSCQCVIALRRVQK